MLTKRSWIVLLGGVNLVLAALLVAGLAALPSAHAQGGARSGDLVTVTALAANRNFDVLYMLDVPARKLHAFYPGNVQAKTIVHAAPRDLDQDFGK